MRKAIGYIIIGDWGPVGLGFNEDAHVLWRNHVTLFHTKKAALDAIKRTEKFVREHHYAWPVKSFIIRTVDFATKP
jgi:hypothetical protein